MSEVVKSEKLYVQYATDADTKVSHSLPVRTDVTAEEVSDTVDAIIAQEVFRDKAGNPLVVAETAYVRKITDRMLF